MGLKNNFIFLNKVFLGLTYLPKNSNNDLLYNIYDKPENIIYYLLTDYFSSQSHFVIFSLNYITFNNFSTHIFRATIPLPTMS